MEIYNENGHSEVLRKTSYKGFTYFIVSYGTHPCCYISLPKGHPLVGTYYDYISSITCHGGLTFSGTNIPIDRNTEFPWVIGWDYAHHDDYFCSTYFPAEGKHWTVEELDEACKNVINQLIQYEKKMY